ncbi:MAG: division/cell wall cluster transcriptional repressor MraZ [Propionibacteriaceae bacterium]|nr:division/cell wall cluster transcriptional repressor MraZ [Propionibacteriaceae bacterium]
MFLGSHFPKVDDKGRFVLPAKFREELGDGLVISKGQERCLVIYTVEGFQQEAQVAMSGPSTLKGIRDFQRMFAAGASQEVPDAQGRVTIPQVLRNYAGLDKEIAVIGAFNRVEVWDLAAWEAYQSTQDDQFAQMDQEIFPGGTPRQQG